MKVIASSLRKGNIVEYEGKLYVVEYCRQTETVGPGSAGYGVGGRVLEVTSAP